MRESIPAPQVPKPAAVSSAGYITGVFLIDIPVAANFARAARALVLLVWALRLVTA